jgi:hypothetical protein
MAQKYANYETDCGECYRYIAQDDPIWFDSNARKLCTTCAAKAGIICPKCNSSKKPQFEWCYECHAKAQKERAASPLRPPD